MTIEAGEYDELESNYSDVCAELADAKHLIRFLASAWHDADKWIWDNAAHLDAIENYPIVQGTSNQMKLKQIGEQPYDSARIHSAVKLMKENK